MIIKVNRVKGYAAGQEVKVGATNNIPDELFWRRRLKDAEIDNCCKIVQSKKGKDK